MNSILLAAQAGAGAGGGMMPIVFLLLMFVVMYFFMIRPQQKKQKEIRKFQNALQEGSNVVTAGGVYGVVKRIDMATNKVSVEVARGVVIDVDRNSVFADATAR